MSLLVATVGFVVLSMQSTAGVVGFLEGVFVAITLRAVDAVFEVIFVTLFNVDVGAVGVFVF